MNKKDIIKRMQALADKEMPDVLSKIDINRIAMDEPLESTKPVVRFRHALSYTFALLFVMISGLMIYQFAFNQNNTMPLASETEIVGFQTVSAAALLDAYSVVELNETSIDYTVTDLNQSSFELEDRLDMVDAYLNMAETMTGKEDNYLYETIESDREDYTHAFLYRAMDLRGQLITYQGYYNDEIRDDHEVKVGILVHQERVFNFSSSYEANEDGSVYRYRVGINPQHYVEVIDVSGDRTQKFSYQVYRQGELDHQSQMTITMEGRMLTTQMTITDTAQRQFVLAFKRNMDDQTAQSFAVNYQILNNGETKEGQFMVDLVFNASTESYDYRYQINQDDVIVRNRPMMSGPPAKDDDFKPGPKGPMMTTEETTTTEDTTTADTHPGNTSPGSTGPGNRPMKELTELLPSNNL